MFLFCSLLSVHAQFSWTSIPSTTTHNLSAVSFADSLVGTAVGDSGTIIRTTDGGLHWTLQSSGTLQRLNSIDQINNDKAIVVGDSAVILRTIDGGGHWSIVFGGQNIVLNDIKMIDADSGVAVGSPSIYRTTDGGVTWISQVIPFAANFRGIAFEDRDSGIVVSYPTFGEMIKTTDDGRSWRTLMGAIDFDLNRITSPKANNYVTVGSIRHSGAILQTTDGGINWAQRYIGANDERYAQDVSFADQSMELPRGIMESSW